METIKQRQICEKGHDLMKKTKSQTNEIKHEKATTTGNTRNWVEYIRHTGNKESVYMGTKETKVE